mmetsp:Transcript_54891/g.122780  ORF Transcript_54891/g.122780 Transcript_54891/m.122780 type:complete len:325 (-) Transcript_54891:337-1311(-)
MARLQSRQDALSTTDYALCVQSLRISGVHVVDPSRELELCVLRTHSRVIEARRDGVRLLDLPVVRLQQIRPRAVQYSHYAVGECGRVLVRLCPIWQPRAVLSARLDTNNLDMAFASLFRGVDVVKERGEHPNRVRATTHASHHRVGQPARTVVERGVAELAGGLVEHLRTRLVTNHRLQVANDVGERVGPDSGTDDVVCGTNVGNPVAEGLVDGILEGAGTRLDGNHFGTHLGHPEAIQLLTLAVDRSHVYDALKVEQGARGGGGDAVLPRSRLRDDPLLAKLHCKQRLPHCVVDLMGTRVSELLSLHPYLRPTAHLRQALGVV